MMWFGRMVSLITRGIGQPATAPVASVLITACAVAKENIWDVSKVNVWFVGVPLGACPGNRAAGRRWLW